MRDFLLDMALSSASRAREARSRVSEPELRRRIDELPLPPRLRLQRGGFDL